MTFSIIDTAPDFVKSKWKDVVEVSLELGCNILSKFEITENYKHSDLLAT